MNGCVKKTLTIFGFIKNQTSSPDWEPFYNFGASPIFSAIIRNLAILPYRAKLIKS